MAEADAPLRRSHVGAKMRRPIAAALLVGVALGLGPTFLWPRSPGSGRGLQQTAQGLAPAAAATRRVGLADAAASALARTLPPVLLRGGVQGPPRSVAVQRNGLSVKQIIGLRYFKREYKKRQRKRMRNWMYNSWQKAQYKFHWKKCFKKIVEIGERSETDAPANLEALITEVKPQLDNVCLLVDEMAIDGIINTGTAMKLKNALFTRLLTVSTKLGFKERTKDRFLPAWATLGYELPKSNHIRQPRPWQLPGHKTLWQIRGEKRMEVLRLKKIREAKVAEPEPVAEEA